MFVIISIALACVSIQLFLKKKNRMENLMGFLRIKKNYHILIFSILSIILCAFILSFFEDDKLNQNISAYLGTIIGVISYDFSSILKGAKNS